MGFSAKQLTALRRDLNARQVRTREAHGRELSYLEGWYVISEANRIFGFDGWSRETLETRCVLARESRGNFLAVYVARVRITVHAKEASVIREGHGSGEGRGTSPAEVHDIAVKAAETDATKRALATFGKPFGLELYRNGNAAQAEKPSRTTSCHRSPAPAFTRTTPPLFRGRHDTTAAANPRRSANILPMNGGNWRLDPQLHRLPPRPPICRPAGSTKASLRSPSQSEYATGRTSTSSRPSLA